MATTDSTVSTGPVVQCPVHTNAPIAACIRCFAARQWQPKLDRLAARRAKAEAAYNKALNAYNKAYNDEADACDMAATAVGLARG
jgi:hypothetical protein